MITSVWHVIAVAAGGAVGAVLRYLLSTRINAWSEGWLLPAGTLVVNVLGCFVIGWTTGSQIGRSPWNETLGLFLVVGLLGGFTTFSAFGNETLALFRAGETVHAFLNMGLQLGACLAAVGAGLALGTSR